MMWFISSPRPKLRDRNTVVEPQKHQPTHHVTEHPVAIVRKHVAPTLAPTVSQERNKRDESDDGESAGWQFSERRGEGAGGRTLVADLRETRQ